MTVQLPLVLPWLRAPWQCSGCKSHAHTITAGQSRSKEHAWSHPRCHSLLSAATLLSASLAASNVNQLESVASISTRIWVISLYITQRWQGDWKGRKSESFIPKVCKISAHEFHVVPGTISRTKSHKNLPILGPSENCLKKTWWPIATGGDDVAMLKQTRVHYQQTACLV